MPMWIVLSLMCLLVLYYIIWSIIFVRTAEVLPAQRRGHVMVAIAAVLLVIPLLTFQVCNNKKNLVYMMLIHESYVFELQTETKSEVCDPCSFCYAT